MFPECPQSSSDTASILLQELTAHQCPGTYIPLVSCDVCESGLLQLEFSPSLPRPGQSVHVVLHSHLALKVEGVVQHTGKNSKPPSPSCSHNNVSLCSPSEATCSVCESESHSRQSLL